MGVFDQGSGSNAAAQQANDISEQQGNEALAFQIFLNDQATSKEDARLKGIKNNLGLVNSLFGGLSFDEFGNAVFNLNKESLQDQLGDANLELTQRLARAGLSGGSVEGDKETEIEDRYGDALQEAKAYASGLESQLMSQAQGLQGQYSALAATGAPISGSTIIDAIGGLKGGQPSLAPGLQDAFGGIYENIGNYLSGLGNLGRNPLATQNVYSSFTPANPKSGQTGTLQGR